jgi:hypothetical protein
MSYLAILVVSFLATLSLGSPLARQTEVCQGFSVANAQNFTLVTVSKELEGSPTFQLPLALAILPSISTTVPVLLVIFFSAISLVIC